MKKVSDIFLILVGLCSFLHYPLALIYPFGLEKSVNLVFDFEFPHIFLAAALSLSFIFLHLGKINYKTRSFVASGAALAMILLSGLIYQVPLYRVVELSAFFTVPLAVFLAVKTGGEKRLLVYMVALVFVLNLLFCLFIPGNHRIGFAANQNWLAATLLASGPFFLLSIKELPSRYYRPIAGLILVLTLVVLLRTSARALIPAVGGFVLYYLWQRKPLRFSVLTCLGVFLLTGALIAFNFDKFNRVISQDIRGPLFIDTCRLIVSTPLLGTGPGNFQKDFPPHASDALKKLIYYSPIVEHPHNEFLHMAASAGLPVGILWLFFMYGILKKRESTEDLFLQFTVLGTMIMGMADKPLTESPAAIIFLVASGLLIPREVYREQASKKILRVLRPVLAVLMLGFGLYRAQLETRSRYYFWKAEDLRASMNTYNQQEVVPLMFAAYLRSAELDPTFINAAYNAACVSLHFYDNLSQDKRLLGNMIRLEPDYADFNLRIAQYYMKQAHLLGAGQEKELTQKEAEKYFLRNYELSPWNINRARSLVRFYVELKQYSEVEKWILKCRDIARERINIRYTHTDRVDLQKDLNLWRQQLLSDKENVIDMTSGLKAQEGGDYMDFAIFTRTNNLQSYPVRPLLQLDRQFWKRRLQLKQFVSDKGLVSSQDILNLMISLELQEEGIKWPIDVLKSGAGNARSLASLACSLNSLLGHDSAILSNKAGEVLCVLFEGEKAYIWNCRTSVLIKSTMADFHSSKELRLQVSHSAEDDFEYELFCYPEAFCLRHQLVSDIVSLHPDIPLLCESPTLSKIRLMQKNGGRKVSYANDHVRLLDEAAMGLK